MGVYGLNNRIIFLSIINIRLYPNKYDLLVILMAFFWNPIIIIPPVWLFKAFYYCLLPFSLLVILLDNDDKQILRRIGWPTLQEMKVLS